MYKTIVSLKKGIRNTTTFAFLQGTYETARSGPGCGRTHPTDQDWNEAYDKGMNFGEKIRSVKTQLVVH